MTQQSETKTYFQSAAGEWQQKAIDTTGDRGEYNIIEGRNNAALDVLERTPGAKRFLDVGCGTGQLVIEASRRGIEADGIDFAPEMIARCTANAKEAGVKSRFLDGSFFDAKFDEGAYDVISAQGFIEYISLNQTDEFFRRCARMLKPGGAVAIGSRNRLFNAFSLNDFTHLESALGLLGTLVAEATILQMDASFETVLAKLRNYERVDPQPDHHPVTGIPVGTRYQFSPCDLMYRLRAHGFVPEALYPVHYHGLPMGVTREHPGLHLDLANVAGRIGFRDHRLVPFSSSYVIAARKL
jgi:2-polyprenyl-3-methyl-5-hydroxy-6-metoxy-1,4-benzoquinol methylase